MTEQEAKKILERDYEENIHEEGYKEEFADVLEAEKVAISALEELQMYKDGKLGLVPMGTLEKYAEDCEKLRKENEALKNRCRALTKGTVCFFCPMECKHRSVKFRKEAEECQEQRSKE